MTGMAKTDDKAAPTRVQLSMNIAGLGNDGDVVEVHAGQAEQLVGNQFATAVVDDETTAADDDGDAEGDGDGKAKTASRSRAR